MHQKATEGGRPEGVLSGWKLRLGFWHGSVCIPLAKDGSG